MIKAHYRDRVRFAPTQLDPVWGDEVRAQVTSVTWGDLVRWGYEPADSETISVHCPPATWLIGTVTYPPVVQWRGITYNVQGRPQPVMIAGRLDHWELLAKATVPTAQG